VKLNSAGRIDVSFADEPPLAGAVEHLADQRQNSVGLVGRPQADLVVEAGDLRPTDRGRLHLVPAGQDVTFDAALIISLAPLAAGMPLQVHGAEFCHCGALSLGLAIRKGITTIDDRREMPARDLTSLI